jgi:hypothetical protein
LEKQVEERLKARIIEFKTGVWADMLREIGSHIEPLGIRLFDYYAPYRVSIEFLKKDEPFFSLTLFFKVFPPSPARPEGSVKPSLSLRKGAVEVSGLERHFKELDREIGLIHTSEIAELVKSLIDSGGAATG